MAAGITNAIIGTAENPYIASTEAKMAQYLADSKKAGSFIQYTGTSGTYVQNEVYRILESGDITQYMPVTDLAQVATINIDAPAAAVNGSITANQLAILQASDNNNLMFNHEKFYLNDKGHSEGFLTYTHVGIENDLVYIKTFTITVNNLTWVLNIRSLPEFEYDASTKTLVITE